MRRMETPMLNEEKIKLMTRLSLYEEGKGKKDIRLSKFYRSDYIRYQILMTVLCTTIAFIILVGLVMMHHAEYIIENALVLDYQGLITYGLTLYALLLVIYGLFTFVLSSVQFHLSRKRLGKYFRGLKQMEAICIEEEKANKEKRPVDDDDEDWEEEE